MIVLSHWEKDGKVMRVSGADFHFLHCENAATTATAAIRASQRYKHRLRNRRILVDPLTRGSVALVRPATRTNLRNAFGFFPGAAEPHMKVLRFHAERPREILDGNTHSVCLLERRQD